MRPCLSLLPFYSCSPTKALKHAQINGAGQLREVVTSGAATISNFLIAPNNKVFVPFSQRTNLESLTTVFLHRVPPCWAVKDSREAVCMDSTLSLIGWWQFSQHRAIQFDSSIDIYYSVRTTARNQVLKKLY